MNIQTARPSNSTFACLPFQLGHLKPSVILRRDLLTMSRCCVDHIGYNDQARMNIMSLLGVSLREHELGPHHTQPNI